jgi:WS/DGAT/MGAT family acyltransferase
MAPGRRIAPVDTIWLNMDRPENLMVIESLLLLERAPDWDRVIDVVRTRLVDKYPVFRERPGPRMVPWRLPRWQPDSDFRLERHVHRVRLPAPGADAELRRYVDRQLHQPLDRDHPLWQVHLIDGYQGGAALLCRVHHALADGTALVRLLLSLTDDDEGVAKEATPPSNRPTGLQAVARTLAPGGLLDVGRLVVRTGQAGASLVLARTPSSVLGGQPGTGKHVVWSQPFSLDDVKKVGRLGGATVNDVLMSAVAGAMHRYQVARGVEPVDLTTMVPVNVRRLDRELPRGLGNRFALVFFTFPSGVAAPLQRLAETKRRMDWLKSSPEAVMTFGLITAIGRTVADVERFIVNFFANKAIGVTTNVPGPTRIRYLAGTKVTAILGWVPGSGRHTVGVCIVTYAGTVRVGFRVDATRVRRPKQLLEAFEAELTDLVGMARPARAPSARRASDAD